MRILNNSELLETAFDFDQCVIIINDATASQQLHHILAVTIGRTPGQARSHNPVIPVVLLLIPLAEFTGRLAEGMLDNNATRQHNHMATFDMTASQQLHHILSKLQGNNVYEHPNQFMSSLKQQAIFLTLA